MGITRQCANTEFLREVCVRERKALDGEGKRKSGIHVGGSNNNYYSHCTCCHSLFLHNIYFTL